LPAQQAAAQTWHTQRLACLPLVEKALELRNQATYVTEQRVESVLGNAVQASRLSANVHTELMGRLQQLNTAQQSMLGSLQAMSNLCNAHCSSEQSMLVSLKALDLADADADADVKAKAEAEAGGAAAQPSAAQAEDEDAATVTSVSVGEEGGGTAAVVVWPLDHARTAEIVSQLQQQTLLEISIYEVLLAEARGTAVAGARQDYDGSVTYLACFSYPPYLSDSALSIVLEMHE